MSENKVRYFRLDDSSDRSGVICSTAENPGHTHYSSPEWTEVQVVPADAIVVDGPLPEVEVSDSGSRAARGDTDRGYSTFHTSGTSGGTGIAPNLMPEWHEFRARQHLALAAHLRDHPPVDGAQVVAVRDALLSADSDDVSYITVDGAWRIARRMVVRGVRVEAKS